MLVNQSRETACNHGENNVEPLSGTCLYLEDGWVKSHTSNQQRIRTKDGLVGTAFQLDSLGRRFDEEVPHKLCLRVSSFRLHVRRHLGHLGEKHKTWLVLAKYLRELHWTINVQVSLELWALRGLNAFTRI